MSPAEVQGFLDNGYAGPFQLKELSRIEQALAFMAAHREPGRLKRMLARTGLTPDRRLDQSRGHVRFRALFDLVTAPQILDDVEALLGPDLLLWKGRIIPRMPGSPGQSWHVDLDNKLLCGVHVSIALNEATPSCGAAQLIPGTHRYATSFERMRRDAVCNVRDAAEVAMHADRLQPDRAPHRVVTMALKPGQYYLTTGALWHGVLPNVSNQPRLLAIGRYMSPEMRSCHWSPSDSAVKVLRDKSQPCILVRGQDRFGRNQLFSPPPPEFSRPRAGA